MGKIVGVMGKARAGKDTIANYLASRHRCVRLALADPMKRFCKEVFQFTDAQLWGDEKEKPDDRFPRTVRWCDNDDEFAVHKDSCYRTEHLTPRFALQTLGTEWGRHCYENLWIDYGIRMAKKLLESPYNYYTAENGLWEGRHGNPKLGVVFSDLRFKNEFQAVRDAGGILIRVKRPNTEAVGIAGHASEMEQESIPDSEFNLIIYNDRTIEDLHQLIEGLVVPMLEKS